MKGRFAGKLPIFLCLVMIGFCIGILFRCLLCRRCVLRLVGCGVWVLRGFRLFLRGLGGFLFVAWRARMCNVGLGCRSGLLFGFLFLFGLGVLWLWFRLGLCVGRLW